MRNFAIVFVVLVLAGCGADFLSPPATPTAPILFSGRGEGQVDVSGVPSPALVIIAGNEAQKYFAVTTRDQFGAPASLAMAVGVPYAATRVLNYGMRAAKLLEIKATGPWQITVTPDLATLPDLTIQRKFTGLGDAVLRLGSGAPCESLEVAGNAEEKQFSVYGHTPRLPEKLIRTNDQYTGIVLLPPGVKLVEVQASGEWLISCLP